MRRPTESVLTNHSFMAFVGLQLLIVMGSILLGLVLWSARVESLDADLTLGSSAGCVFGVLLVAALVVHHLFAGDRVAAMSVVRIFTVLSFATLGMALINVLSPDLVEGRGVLAVALLCTASAKLTIDRVL